MKLILLAAAVLALATAKPETYKEKEDFQFSRSSSDDGTKSGYYGAQRGNMGGNYERAHNMDSLAQNQMSGLVKQVQGELGDGSSTRTGSVYSAANSRGIYGSGNYDLSNLAGRNFHEGVTYGDSESHSSMNSAYQHQSSSASKSGYNTNQYQASGLSGGYQAQGTGYTGQIQSSNLHAQAANTGNRGSEYNYAQEANQRTGYYSQSRNQGQSMYDKANTASSFDYGSNVHSRLISATPVRVVIRPGTRVTIPVAAQTYDDSIHSFSSNGQNSANTEAEILSNIDHQTIYQVTTKPKHYESSYKYHKEWEKHDTQPIGVPLAVPTSNTILKNNELYEDTQAHKTDSQFDAVGVGSLYGHSSNAYSGYNANSAASQSQYQTDYNSQLQESLSHSNLNSNANGFNANANGFNANANGFNANGKSADSTIQIDLNSKPKSYQSSYAYHKSWERQGDPYVIRPASGGIYDGQASQKLTSASSNQGTYGSQQYGSHYQQSQQRYVNRGASDCDENGHLRVARSYDTQQTVDFNENLQSQNGQEEMGQKAQNLEDFGEQSQTQWNNQDDLGQQTQNKWDKIEDVGQQAQNKWDNLEDLGQQTQKKWDNIEDAGQHTQNKWDNENVGQQAQNKWDNLEDLGQQTQQKWDKLEEAGQQTQNKWDNLEDLGQQAQKDLGQQLQDMWNNFDIRPLENDGQQTQTNWESQINQQVQSSQDGQVIQTATHIEPENIHRLDNNSSTPQKETDVKPDMHHVQIIWDKIGGLDQSHNDNKHKNENVGFEVTKPVWELNVDDTQQNVFDTGFELYPYGNPQHMNDFGYLYPHVKTGHHNSFNMYSPTDTSSENPTSNNKPYEDRESSNIPSTSSLGSLWNKIDHIVKEPKSNDTQETHNNDFETSNSQHSYQNIGHAQSYNYNSESSQHSYFNSETEQAETYHYNNNFNSSHKFHTNQSGFHFIGVQQPSILNENKTSTEKPINDNKLRPQDLGRGDIGPEDLPTDEINTNETLEYNNSSERRPTYGNQYKTPQEIDSLSLIKENNTNQNNNLPSDSKFNVSSLHQQKWREHHLQHAESDFSYSTSSTTTSTAPKNNDDDTNNQPAYKLNENQQFISDKEVSLQSGNNESSIVTNKSNTTSILDQGPEEIFQHDIGQKGENSEQQNGNFGQQQKIYQFGQQHEQQNMGQQFDGFGQQYDSRNTADQLVDFGQQHDQQKTADQFVDFGQQHDQIDQQNTAGQFVDFGQQHDQIDQQNTAGQLNDFGQQHDQIDQQNTAGQLVDFEHQQDQINQQNTATQLVDLGQQHEQLDQQNTADQFVDFGQQHDQLDQQNTAGQFVDFGQQHDQIDQKNTAEQFVDFGQQHDQIDQQNTADQFVDFGQQHDQLDKQNTAGQFVDIGQQNVEQQLVDLGQPNENLSQHVEEGQQEQTPWNHNERLKLNGDSQSPDIIEIEPIHEEKEEPFHIEYNDHNLGALPTHKNIKPEVDIVAPEEVTEKPGFWKSVGNKFTGAKDKVFSWFKKS